MTLWFDLKYAWRLLLKSPGHSLLCVVVIALSVGLALWAYVCAYTMAFKPLGFPGSEYWYSVQIAAEANSIAQPQVDAFTYQRILDRTRTTHHLGAVVSRAVVLSEGEASSRLRAAGITPALFAATTVKPQLGRLFVTSESEVDASPVVILSDQTWRTYFAADPAIVGKHTRIDSRTVEIIGVMPQGFFAFKDDELWMPLQLPRIAEPGDSALALSPFIVVKNEQDLVTVLNEIKVAVDETTIAYPNVFKPSRHVELVVGHRWDVQGSLQIITMCTFIATAVLIMGIANTSTVFLARLLERSRELALRTALGASRARLLRQCLLETAALALLGMLGGYGFAAIGLGWSQGVTDSALGIMAEGRWFHVPTFKPSDVFAAFAIASVVWLFSTLIPAWRVAKQDAVIALSGSGKGVASLYSGKSTRTLVGVQVLTSCLVLVMCANMVLAVKDEASEPTGIKSAGVSLSTYPTSFGSHYEQASERQRYWNDLTLAIKQRVAEAEVAFASAPPTGPSNVEVSIEQRESTARDGTLSLPLAQVSDNYFDLVGITLNVGRLFASSDSELSTQVAILDERTARRFWPNQDVIGKRIQLNPNESGTWLTIVGVVSHVRRIYAGQLGVIYQPLRQSAPGAFHLLAKLPASVDVHAGHTALRAAAFAVDPNLPLHNLRTLDEYLYASNLVFEMFIPGFTVIGAITAILAASGLFGLISRSVVQRTHEIGIRRALGATRWQATATFLRQGGFYLVVGIIGLGLGTFFTSMVAASVPNVLAHVLPVTVAVLFLVALVIFVASYLPTRRAVALEPGDALRHE